MCRAVQTAQNSAPQGQDQRFRIFRHSEMGHKLGLMARTILNFRPENPPEMTLCRPKMRSDSRPVGRCFLKSAKRLRHGPNLKNPPEIVGGPGVDLVLFQKVHRRQRFRRDFASFFDFLKSARHRTLFCAFSGEKVVSKSIVQSGSDFCARKLPRLALFSKKTTPASAIEMIISIIALP